MICIIGIHFILMYNMNTRCIFFLHAFLRKDGEGECGEGKGYQGSCRSSEIESSERGQFLKAKSI